MVGSGATRLAPEEQATLAQWLYKTGLMVSTTNRDEATSLPKIHYADLASSLDLPPGSAVWIGTIERPAYEGALWVQRFHWSDRELANAPMGEGYMFALSIADLAGVVAVFDLRQSPDSPNLNPFILGGLSTGRLLRIWPTAEFYSITWPPPLKLSATDFQSPADSFQKLGAASTP